MEIKERIALWDNIKFLLIVLVVVGHFCDMSIESTGFKSIFVFIYAFHMPLFIFIAGLFHRDKNIREKVVSYIIFGVLLEIVNFTIRYFLYGDGGYSVFNITGISWYMIAMAVFIGFTYGIRDLNKKMIFVVSLALCCYACYDKQMGDMFSWGRIVEFYPFYLLGNMLDPKIFLNIKKHRFSTVTGAVIVAGWLVACFVKQDSIYKWRRIFTGHVPFCNMDASVGIEEKVLCLLISAVLCFGVILLMPSARIPLVSKWGTRTLQVYLWHYPALYFFVGVLYADRLCGSFAGNGIYVILAVFTACLLSLPAFGYPVNYVLNHLKS